LSSLKKDYLQQPFQGHSNQKEINTIFKALLKFFTTKKLFKYHIRISFFAALSSLYRSKLSAADISDLQ